MGLGDLRPYVLYGASPRAAINLILSAKALAYVRGRAYALPGDVHDLALDVMRHRLVLSYEALADGVSRRRRGAPDPRRRSRSRSSAERPDPRPDDAAPPVTPEQVLQRLDWRVIRRLDGLLQGDYRTLFYGPGVDFADLREYEPGDDVRHIDWNVTARMDTPYVRQYVADRELTAWLLLDRSPSMGFGASDRPKEDVLTEFVATIARLLTRGGNRVGAVLYDNAVEQIIEPRQRAQPGVADRTRAPAAAGRERRGDRPRRARAHRRERHPAPIVGLRDLRLHQRAGLGAWARTARAAPRGGRDPGLGPA